jgi:amidase
MTPLEVGTDLAGSIRLPAHFCGVYGLKTTEHRVPFTGFFRQPEGIPRSVRIMSCLGPMARDLGDLELALRIIAGPDGQDGDVPPVPLGAWSRRSRRGARLQDLRLAVAADPPGGKPAKSIRQRVERVAAQASAAGAKVEERLPELDWSALFKLFGDLASTITSLFTPGAHLRDEQRMLAWYFEALDRRDRFMSSWQAFFEDFDALLLPPALTTAFAHCKPGASVDVDGKAEGYWEIGGAAPVCNLTGLPGLVVPAGLDDLDGAGLPIGLQLVGPLWSEMRLLEIAGALERAEVLPGFQAPPGY